MNKKKITVIILAILLFFGSIGTTLFYKSQNPQALKIKKRIKYILVNKKMPKIPEETTGLDNIKRVELYENNCLTAKEKTDFSKDNKKIYVTDTAKRLINYSSGYSIDLPADTKFDFSYGTLHTTAYSDKFKLKITREYSPYDDVDEYINHYLNRFILSEEYQKANDITLLKHEKKDNTEIITARLNNLNGNYDTYTYVTITTSTRIFYRFMFKYNGDLNASIDIAINNFKFFEPSGDGYFDLDFHPEIPKNWTDETKKLYEKIKNSDKVYWGIFAKDVYTDGITKTIPKIENKINYKFPVILSYIHFKTEFPSEFMQKNYDNGRIVELTYQITESNNEKLFNYTPNIDMYRGLKDDEIRKFAKAAKNFGHPFLFRLNNEMNSDWTSYSGVVNMSDPDIYIENWQRFYRIFKEEGVNNAIWIFNPNDRNYPPCDWNNYLAYYPGNEYVQLLGVTGYNNGTYYKDVTGETWREFKDIYDEVEEKYKPYFNDFPWIITEFSSSSVGGDKVQWINNMFKVLPNYKYIKIAVWFSYADYDFREGNEKLVARPYWLDETEKTLDAFKNGVKKNSASSLYK